MPLGSSSSTTTPIESAPKAKPGESQPIIWRKPKGALMAIHPVYVTLSTLRQNRRTLNAPIIADCVGEEALVTAVAARDDEVFRVAHYRCLLGRQCVVSFAVLGSTALNLRQ